MPNPLKWFPPKQTSSLVNAVIGVATGTTFSNLFLKKFSHADSGVITGLAGSMEASYKRGTKQEHDRTGQYRKNTP